MIFSQYANNHLPLSLSRTSPGMANTRLHSLSFASPCKSQGCFAPLYYNYVLNLFQSLPFIQLANESCAHKWQAEHTPSFSCGILHWYNLELQTPAQRTFAPSPIDLNNSPGGVLRLSKCLYWTNVPLRQQLWPQDVKKKYKMLLLSLL